MGISDKLQYTIDSLESIRQDINNKSGSEMIVKGTPLSEWVSLMGSFGSNVGTNQEIEVSTLLESNGVVTQQTVSAIPSKAYTYKSFYDMLNHNSSIVKVLNAYSNRQVASFNYTDTVMHPTNVFSSTFPLSTVPWGIFAMRDPIPDLNSNIEIAPYLSKNQRTVDPTKVVFYNLNNSLVEATDKMAGSNTKCYFETTDGISFVMEYTKTTGSGTVGSIAIGRGPSTDISYHGNVFSIIRDPNIVHNDWASTNGNTVIEYIAGDELETIIWKSKGSVPIGFNFKTLETINSTDSNFSAKINMAKNAIKIGQHLYSVFHGSASATTITVNLMKYNCTNNSAGETIPISVPLDGITGYDDSSPLLLYNTDSNRLEIFTVIGYGGGGWQTRKITVDPYDTSDATIENLGPLQFQIYNTDNSTATSATIRASWYKFGYYDNGKYYLPIAFLRDGGSTYQMRNYLAGNIMHYGIVTSDFINYDFTTFGMGDNQNYYKIKSHSGEVRNIMIGTGSGIPIAYVYTSQLLCAVNLPTPVIKASGDVLTIRLKFKMSIV